MVIELDIEFGNFDSGFFLGCGVWSVCRRRLLFHAISQYKVQTWFSSMVARLLLNAIGYIYVACMYYANVYACECFWHSSDLLFIISASFAD